MAATVKARINTVTLTCGITILVLGILMFPTDFVIVKLMGEKYAMSNQPQYWGVLPVIITGIVVIVSSRRKNPPGWLKILSAIFLLVTMFVNLAVIIEQGNALSTPLFLRKYCDIGIFKDFNIKDLKILGDLTCSNVGAVEACFQILLLFSAFTLVVCLAALLAMHANWILDLQQHNGNEDAESQPLVMRTYELAYEPDSLESQPGHNGVMRQTSEGSHQHYHGGQHDV